MFDVGLDTRHRENLPTTTNRNNDEETTHPPHWSGRWGGGALPQRMGERGSDPFSWRQEVGWGGDLSRGQGERQVRKQTNCARWVGAQKREAAVGGMLVFGRGIDGTVEDRPRTDLVLNVS